MKFRVVSKTALEKAVEKLQKDAAEQRKREIVDNTIEVQTVLFEKASSYTNLVLGLGYAGFYTTWAFLKDAMPHKAMVGSALAMAVSLFFFIIWEVIKALFTSYKVNFGISDLSKSPAEQIEQRLETYRQSHRNLSRMIMPVWRVVLLLILLPALTAIGLLFWALTCDLLMP